MRFFNATTLGKKELAKQIPFARVEETLPAVLSVQLLRPEPDLMLCTIFITIYAAAGAGAEALFRMRPFAQNDLDQRRVFGPISPARRWMRSGVQPA